MKTLSIKSKRGTHVGVVISFVIFVTFIIFIYLAVQPKIGTVNKKNLLEQIKNNLIDEISTSVTSVSVLLATSVNCVKLEGFFSESGMGPKIKVSNQAGGVLPATAQDPDLFVSNNQAVFLNIYESDEFGLFSPPITSCANSPTYKLGLIKTSNSILESKIIKLIEDYKNDEGPVKDSLGVPEGNELAIGFTNNDGTTTETTQPDVSISVFSDDVLIRYINQNGVEESGLLNVKIW